MSAEAFRGGGLSFFLLTKTNNNKKSKKGKRWGGYSFFSPRKKMIETNYAPVGVFIGERATPLSSCLFLEYGSGNWGEKKKTKKEEKKTNNQ